MDEFAPAIPDVGTPATLTVEPERKKPRSRKPPIYELPTLGRIIHVVADMNLAARFNCDVGVHCAALVTSVPEGAGYFTVTVYSPTRNPHVPYVQLWYTDGEPMWHWPERD